MSCKDSICSFGDKSERIIAINESKKGTWDTDVLRCSVHLPFM